LKYRDLHNVAKIDYVKYISYNAGNTLTVNYAINKTLENRKRSLYQAT